MARSRLKKQAVADAAQNWKFVLEQDEKKLAPGEKPTLKTISRLSGLAVPTVSRALNDAPDIGADTKKLIRRIADEIGYVPNRAGVRLRTGRTNVISLVLSTEHEQMNHTAKLISSIAYGLRDTPYHLVMKPFFPDEDPMKPIRYIVETGSADAIIFNQIMPKDPRVEYLMERKFPFATHGRGDMRDKHAWADFDNDVFGRVAVRALVKRGRRNLRLICPPLNHSYGADTARGALAEAAELGITLKLFDEVTSDSLSPDIHDTVARALTVDPTIDGIISGSTGATMAAIAGMEQVGFDVGTDIDVFAKEAIRFLKNFRPKILVIEEDVGYVGEFLAQAAMAAVKSPKAPPMHWLQTPEDYDTD